MTTEVKDTIKKKAAPKTAIKKATEPKKPRQKKLSLKSIQAQESKINEWSTYVINEEDNTVIKYYKIFDETKIQYLLTEAYEKSKYARENEIDFFLDDSQLYSFISYLAIKWFTHLGEELKDSSLEDDIAAMSALISTGLFKTILNDVFDGNEVQRILSVMHEHIAISAKVEEFEKQNQKDMKSQLKVLN